MLEIFALSDDVISLIYEWRKDPLTCQMSRHFEVKERGMFARDLQREVSFEIPSVFFVEEGVRKAYFSFKPAFQGIEISFNVSPLERSKGVGTRALNEVMGWLSQRGVDVVVAQVKEGNTSSRRLLINAGFQESSLSNYLIEDTGEEISMYTYLYRFKRVVSKVFIIAEVGSNFKMGTRQDDESMAKKLILAAKEAGCDAVKFQTFRARTTYVPNAGLSGYLNKEITSLFKELEMPYDMLPFLAKTCDEMGIEFMSTAFSEKDFLAVDPYVKRHKIASYENGYEALIALAAQSKKPTLISTGASTMTDICFAVDTFAANGGDDLTLMQCTAKYPAPIDSLDLSVISTLAKTFKTKVGLSDHSEDPLIAPIVAVALGAQVIEKHFTLDKTLPGPDHKFAVTPLELKALVNAVRETEKSLGSSFKQVHREEEELFHFAKRGIQAIRPIKKGDIFVLNENIQILRPGQQKKGIHPMHLSDVLEKKATRSLSLGEGIQFGDWE